MSVRSCQVAVVGAGPTGLTLALDLARRGVSVSVLEAAPGPRPGSRGKVVSVRTQEVFDDFGIADGLGRAGLAHLRHRVYLRGELVRDYDPAADGAPRPDRPFDYSPLFIPQWRLESMLRTRLGHFGIRPEFDTRVAGLEQDADGVSLKLADGDSLTADWVVGCDGAHSTVRTALGLRFAAVGDGGGQGMLLGDVHVDGLTPDRWYQWSDPRRGFAALCPFRDSDTWQFQGGLFEDTAAGTSLPTPDVQRFQRTLDAVSGRDDIRLSDPSWTSTWRANVRMVEQLRSGRVFIAGDAAHVHPPTGGLGMNTGIQDAYNLGWKLGCVIAGADTGLLDSYGEERLPIAAWTLGLSTDSLRMLDAELTGGGFEGIAATAGRDVSQLRLGYPWSSLAVAAREPVSAVAAGDRAPDVPCVARNGEASRLFDVLRGPHFTLLGFGAVSAPAVHALSGPGWPVRGAVVGPEPGDEVDLIDRDGFVRRVYRAIDGALLLIRPDGYVGVTAVPGDVAAISGYLSNCLGSSIRSAPPNHD